MTIVAGRGARALCDTLARDHMTVERKGAGLTVRPATLVVDELLEQLVRYKPELLGALRRAEALGRWAQLRGCPGCDSQFLAGGERLCPWCDQADVFGERPYQPRSLTATRTVPGQLGQLAYANCPDGSADTASLTGHQDS